MLRSFVIFGGNIQRKRVWLISYINQCLIQVVITEFGQNRAAYFFLHGRMAEIHILNYGRLNHSFRLMTASAICNISLNVIMDTFKMVFIYNIHIIILFVFFFFHFMSVMF